jgi:hypothetical protein
MPTMPTKITIPELPVGLMRRPHLLAALREATGQVLVCAPAGYGKTSLLADWAGLDAHTATDTAWVSLDREDNDPPRLWASVVAAVAGCPSVPVASRFRTPFRWRPGSQPEFIAEFVDALGALPRPVRLVFDDLHELADPHTLRGVEILLRNRPASTQIVLASRFDPPLGLPKMRLQGQLWELRADRLGFAAAETTELLANSGLQLSPAQAELLHQHTGGWAAGLRLAADALTQAPDRDEFLARFSGDERCVADYLVGEILSRLPPDTVEFLRVISIDDPVPATLAAALSGRQDAGRLLDCLDHETSLITATDWRREVYHVQDCYAPTCWPTCDAGPRTAAPPCAPRPRSGGPSANTPSRHSRSALAATTSTCYPACCTASRCRCYWPGTTHRCWPRWTRSARGPPPLTPGLRSPPRSPTSRSTSDPPHSAICVTPGNPGRPSTDPTSPSCAPPPNSSARSCPARPSRPRLPPRASPSFLRHQTWKHSRG